MVHKYTSLYVLHNIIYICLTCFFYFLSYLMSSATEPPTFIPEMDCITDIGVAYRGTIAVTVTGKTCQRWSAQTPHKHHQIKENCPYK